MEREAFGPLLIGVLVVGAIAAGLSITGGPITARAEKRDMARLADLRKLQAVLTCLYSNDDVLPDTLTADARCADTPPMTDPITDKPYVYEKLSDKTYRLCAEFERPELMSDFDLGSGQLQPENNCFVLSQN
ncbi:hypothetical protein K3556_13955 [Aliiroseovarius sp. M344]|uniref:hypothetical protein n=1 Tax=Aliiroseovarius sp. M344 TaxID=2867010 RepID=UPI0021ADE9FF|nr:hypothetical protein [Aliiroseovarius sp. M344]UWQ14010.1 hypothetical protein K3556_13955 [Aliiroseovarius sp. M344]